MLLKYDTLLCPKNVCFITFGLLSDELMPKDFASQARKPQAKKRRTKTKQKRPRKSNNSPMFHGPSFSAGTIIGAIIVFTMAYAPELLVNNSAKLSEVGGATKETEQIVEITFPQLLRESEVTTNTSTYQVAAIRKTLTQIRAPSVTKPLHLETQKTRKN